MPHLTRLSAAFQDVLYDEFLLAPFSNLTHLGILSFNGDSWEGHWEILTHLPKLTHLLITYNIHLAVASKLLLFCPLLKVMIVIATSPSYVKDGLEIVDDNRFVLLKSLTSSSLVEDWEKGANGGVDRWFFCELIVVFARRSEYSFGSSFAQLLY